MTQAFHRHLSLISVALLVAHVLSAELDTFVDIRWWQAVVPFGGSYRPVWLALGALALDAIAIVVATSLVRTWLGHRRWRMVHLLAYVAWATGIVHGVGIGTDSHSTWFRALALACVAVVGLVTAARLVGLVVADRAGAELGDAR